MFNNSQSIKEFYDLNGYYLRLHLTNQQLSIISYNSNLLDGIKYETKIKTEDIIKNDKIKNFTLMGLYELICNKIKDKKYIINGNENTVTLSLLDSIVFNPNKDIQITLLRNNNDLIHEYENVISNIIMNLREDNRNLHNEINEIKNLFLSNNNKSLSNSKRPIEEVKKLNNYNTQPSNQISNINVSQSQNIVQNLPNQLKNSIGNIPHPLSGPIQNINTNESANLNKAPMRATYGGNNNFLKNFENLDIDSLSKLEYKNYPKVELSPNSFNRISAYGVNSYHGIFKYTNEDKTKVILDYKHNQTIKSQNGNIIIPKVSYFAIYDGHGGNKCSLFLQEKLDSLLFNSSLFPLYPLQAIYEAFTKAEEEFNNIAFDAQKGIMLDKSGSCSLSTLFIDDWCYVTYLGDSRGIYSFDSGNQLFQITRDHKPNDLTEKTRIEKAGGRIYKDTRLKINGQKIHVKEEDAPGVQFPFRVIPGNLSVSFIIYNFIGCKNNRRHRL